MEENRTNAESIATDLPAWDEAAALEVTGDNPDLTTTNRNKSVAEERCVYGTSEAITQPQIKKKVETPLRW